MYTPVPTQILICGNTALLVLLLTFVPIYILTFNITSDFLDYFFGESTEKKCPSSMMDVSYNCPQCKNVLNSSASRLVQDTCGHKKCRMCLLEDETRCLLCIAEQNIQNPSKSSVSAADIDNHTAVIRYSIICLQIVHGVQSPN